MNDQEIYVRWLAHYESLDNSALTGMIGPDDFDRLVRNMEERLGVNKWTAERWARAGA